MAEEQKEENSTKLVTVAEMDAAFGRYYKSLNKPYDKNFFNYCEENGIDDELMESEMNEVNNSILQYFDEQFPYPESAKNKDDKFIASIILACYNDPKIEFIDGVPK